MPPTETPLERARAAAARLEELDELARDADAWAREVERLEHEVGAAHDEALAAVTDAERAEAAARSQRGLFAKVRNRLAGHAPAGDDERAARSEADLATASARRTAAEALLRKLQGDLEEAKRKRMLAEGARTNQIAARQAERKAFAALPATGRAEIDGAVQELLGAERRCDAWRSAQRAAAARRDHAVAAYDALQAFEQSWPALRASLGDVVRGDAGPPPVAALEALRRLRSELWQGARAGVAGLGSGVLAEIAGMQAHEIDRPANVARIAAMLTRATAELAPIADATEKNYADLEAQLASTEASAEGIRARLHGLVLGR